MARKKDKKNRPSITVGMAVERFMFPEFIANRDRILQVLADAGYELKLYAAGGHRVDRNRDRIVKTFLDYGTEWLLMLDTDMEHPPDIGPRLVRWNKPIVAGLYFHRGQQHDPFFFREAPGHKDDYGRDALMWAPMRDEVYDFLINNQIPLRDGSFIIDDPIGTPLIECDAVATGTMLLHRSVFEKMPAPWFEYRAGGNSEDLMFCYEARRAGFPIFGDMSTVSGHYNIVPMGQAQFRMKYEGRGVDLTAFTKAHCAAWISDLLNLSLKKSEKLIENGNAAMVGPIWNQRFNGNTPTEEEVAKFYRDPEVGKAYLVELMWWNNSPGFNILRTQLTKIRKRDVLEIGAGIGTVALQLIVQKNNVLACEPNEILRNLIDKRYQELLGEIDTPMGQLSIVDTSWEQKTPDKSFDVVVAFDVLEHLPLDVLKTTVANIGRVLKHGGSFIFHNNFKQQDIYPMHFDHSAEWEKLLNENGFLPVSQMEAMKIWE